MVNKPTQLKDKWKANIIICSCSVRFTQDLVQNTDTSNDLPGETSFEFGTINDSIVKV